jgi:WD40 repeat protein
VQREEPLILIVDALDEATYYGPNNIARLLYEWMDEFPVWIKIIITSRKVKEILSLLDFYKPFEINIDSPDNKRDIRKYIFEMLSAKTGFSFELGENDPSIEIISNKSEGIFLYARTIVQNLLSGTIGLSDISSLPPGLSAIYNTNFSRIFSGDIQFSRVKKLLEIILAAFEPLTIEDLSRFHKGDGNAGIKKQVNAVAEFFPEKDGTISAFHKSLADWLSGSTGQVHDFLCDINLGHAAIAQSLLHDWKIDKINDYLIEYLPKHLYYAGLIEKMQEVLGNVNYIEKRCAKQQIYRLIEDYRLLIFSSAKQENRGDEPDSQIWDKARYDYESSLFKKSLTPETKISIIHEFLYKQAGLIQRYGHVNGFIKQQAFNDGLIPFVLSKDSGDTKQLSGFLFTGISRKDYDPFPPVMKTFNEHHRGIGDLAISKEGHRFASSSFDRTVKLWNLVNGECLKTVKFESVVETIAMASDVSFITIAGQIAGYDILFFDKDMEQILFRLKGHTDKVAMIKLSQNDKRLVSCSSDNSFRVWSVMDKDLLFQKEYPDNLLSCSISSDGSTVAISTSEGLVEVWNIDFDVPLFSRKFLKGEIRIILLTPDSKEIIIGGGSDKTTEVWDINQDKLKYKIEGHGNITYSLCFDAEKSLLATGGKDRFLKIWDFKTGDLVKMFESHTRVTRRIVANGKMGKVITGGGWRSDNSIRLWDIFRSQGLPGEQGTSLPIYAIYPVEDQGLLLCVNRKQVYCINTKNGERKVLRDKLSVQVSIKSGYNIFIGLQNGSIISYDLVKGKWELYYQHSELITAMLPLPDRAMLMGDWKGNVLLYKNGEVSNIESNIELKIKKILEIRDYNLVLGYDDRFLFIDKITGSIAFTYKHEHRITSNVVGIDEHLYFGDAEGNIISYNLASRVIETIKSGHEAKVTNVVQHEATNRIISACGLGHIRIWMYDLSGPVLDIAGHDDGINFVDVLNGPYFISVSGSGFAFQHMGSDEGNDNTIKKWNIFTGHCEGVYAADELITAIGVDSTGKIFSGQRNGQLHQFVSAQINGDNKRAPAQLTD